MSGSAGGSDQQQQHQQQQQHHQQQYHQRYPHHHRVPSFEHRDGHVQPPPPGEYYYPPYGSSPAPMQYQPPPQQSQPTSRQASNPMTSTPITGTPPTNPTPSPIQQHQHRPYYPSPSSAPAHIPSYQYQGYYQPQQQPYAHYPHPAESSSQAQAQSPQVHHRNSNPGIYSTGPGQGGPTPSGDYAPPSATTPTFASSPWSANEQARTASPAWQHSPRVNVPPSGAWYPPPPTMHPYPTGWQSAPGWSPSSSTSYPPPYPYATHPMANPIQQSAPPHVTEFQKHQPYPMKREASLEDDPKHGKKKKHSVPELESPVHKVAAQSNLHPPRQASSAWQLFFTDTLNAAKEAARNQLGASPGSSKDHPKLNVAHIAREAGVAYANMSVEQKAYYAGKVQESKDQYARELAAWQATLTPDDIRAENAFRAQQRKEGKSRKGNLKDPNAPKKPLSAYFLYLRSIRENPELRKEVWGDEVGTTKQSVLAAQRWRNLTDDEKRPYLAQADKDKTLYETLRRAYEEEAAARARGVDIPVKSPLPSTPTTASGPPAFSLNKRKREGDDQGQGPVPTFATSPMVKHSPTDFPTPTTVLNPTLSLPANSYPEEINNAGLGFPPPFSQMTTEEWQPMHADDGGVPFGGPFPSMDYTAVAYMSETGYASAPAPASVSEIPIQESTSMMTEELDSVVQEPASASATVAELEIVQEPAAATTFESGVDREPETVTIMAMEPEVAQEPASVTTMEPEPVQVPTSVTTMAIEPEVVHEPTATTTMEPELVQEPETVTSVESEPETNGSAPTEPSHEAPGQQTLNLPLSAQGIIPPPELDAGDATESVHVEEVEPEVPSAGAEPETIEAAELAPDLASSEIASVVTPIDAPLVDDSDSAAPAETQPTPSKPDVQELSEDGVVIASDELPVEPKVPAEVSSIEQIAEVTETPVDTDAIPPTNSIEPDAGPDTVHEAIPSSPKPPTPDAPIPDLTSAE